MAMVDRFDGALGGDAVFKAESLAFAAGGVAALGEARSRGCRDDEREGEQQAGFPQGEWTKHGDPPLPGMDWLELR
jgi:hypothetical protein